LLSRGAAGPALKLLLSSLSKPTWAGEGECCSGSDGSSNSSDSSSTAARAAGARTKAGAVGTASTNNSSSGCA
jgi:hypothetical protein